jgi:hypothetical protein
LARIKDKENLKSWQALALIARHGFGGLLALWRNERARLTLLGKDVDILTIIREAFLPL